MTEGLEPFSEALEEARERSLEEDLRDLAGHVREFARAELSFQKTRAAFAGKSAGWISLCIAAGLTFLLLAVMALVFGVILALTPLLTAWGATALVCMFLLAAAALSFFSALYRWRKMTALLEGEDGA